MLNGIRLLLGEGPRFEQSQRLLNAIALVLMLISVVALGINLAIGITPYMNLLLLFTAPTYAGIYAISRFGGRRWKMGRNLLLMSSCVFITLIWFLNGGVVGSAPLVYLSLVLMCGMLMDPLQHRWFFPAICVHLAILMLGELLLPAWIIPYPSHEAQIQDLFTTLYFTVPLLLGVLLYSKHSYVQESLRAERADQLKSQFLATMSHELRTPLNAIIGFTHLLLRRQAQEFSATQRLYLERVDNNALHLLNLINDILDLSRIEAAEVQLKRGSVDVAELVREVCGQVEALAEEKGLKMEQVTPEVLLPLQTDVARLRQILTNLVGNALKFTERGHVSVRVQASAQGKPEVIHVSDTGLGIPADQLERIFEAFIQLDAGQDRRYGGTGLGLHITQRLADLLGYRLQVQSTPGQGSCFSLLLGSGQSVRAVAQTGPLSAEGLSEA